MNEFWIVSIETSLPGTMEPPIPRATDLNSPLKPLKEETLAFCDFEQAKAAARAKIKELAFSENSMFDRNGQLKQLNHYISQICSCDEDDEDLYAEPDSWDDYLGKDVILQIRDALNAVFSGNDTALDLKNKYYWDSLIGVTVKDGGIAFCGDDDGPCNGYDPVLRTNMFSMKEENDYYLEICDRFGQDEFESKLKVDLRKVKLA